MGEWTAQLGEDSDADELTFDENVTISIDPSQIKNEAGETMYTEANITITGTLTSSIASGVSARVNQVRTVRTPLRLRIYEDDVEIFDFEVGPSIGSPYVANFRTIPSEGQGESDWNYEMVVYVKEPGNLFGGAHELISSVKWQENPSGQVISKQWSASAKHKDGQQAALAVVKAFHPGDSRAKAEYETISPNQATALYSWTASESGGGGGGLAGIDPQSLFEVVENPPTITPLGPEWLPSGQIKADGTRVKPKLHEAVAAGFIITISGILRGFKNVLPEPAQHITETEDIKRDRGRERAFTTIVDPNNADKDVFMRPFEEMYIWAAVPGATPPTVKHTGHMKAEVIQPPGDGLGGTL